MRPATVLAYLCIPALLTLGTFVVALRREPFGFEMFAATVLGGYLFYAAPQLLWVFIGSLVRFSNAMWHAGLVAASIALAAIAAVWLGPGDPSGLPIQWLVYWPLAVVLQLVVGGITALYRRARAPNSALLTDALPSALRASSGAAKRER